MRYLIYGLLFTSTSLFAQTYPVPVAIFDSMTFEIRKGRECSNVLEKQANEIQAQGKELIAQAKAIELQTEENKSLEFLYQNVLSELSKTKEADKLDLKKERRKKFKVTLVAIGEFIVIVVLLI